MGRDSWRNNAEILLRFCYCRNLIGLADTELPKYKKEAYTKEVIGYAAAAMTCCIVIGYYRHTRAMLVGHPIQFNDTARL
jgi:hypothetical protein